MNYKVMSRTKKHKNYCIAEFLLKSDAIDFIKYICHESERYWIEEITND